MESGSKVKSSVAVRKSSIQGLGVFALKDFEAEEAILIIDDSDVIADPSKLTKHDHEFELDYLENGKIVRMKAPEKYINHSCDPDSYAKTINGARKIFALRKITAGEEITYDYSMNDYSEGTFKCHCGAENCRKIYQGNFFKLPREIQTKYLPYLEAWFKNEHRDEIDLLVKSERVPRTTLR